MDVDGAETGLHRIWIRKLYAWWRHYNEEYLNGILRSPRIELGGGEQILGSWDGTRRILRIAVAHIEVDPWLYVMETLRHEMAHQYVAEVLEMEAEAPHGEAFRRACEKLRCTPAARVSREPVRLEIDSDRLLRRLQKVFFLKQKMFGKLCPHFIFGNLRPSYLMPMVPVKSSPGGVR